jgi:hypothetical protein
LLLHSIKKQKEYQKAKERDKRKRNGKEKRNGCKTRKRKSEKIKVKKTPYIS